MSLWNLLGTMGGAAGGYALAENLGATGDAAATQMGELAGQLQQDTAFKGYGVTTGLGTSTIGADGTTELGVGVNAPLGAAGQAGYTGGMGAMTNAQTMLGANSTNPYGQMAISSMQGAQNGLMNQQSGAYGAAEQFRNQSMMDTAGREQEIYNRSMAMQQSGLDANRAQTNAQEYASGRGGVMGSQFGGSGEDAAMARAQAQAQNQASFQAMGQASQEQMNQANMANQYATQGIQASGLHNQIGQNMNQAGVQNTQLGQQAANYMGSLGAQQTQAGMQGYQNSFLPMEQQMKMMGLSQNNANLAQTGQLSGAGYAAQLGLGGIQAQIEAQNAAANIYGNMFGSMMNNSQQIGDDLSGLWSDIKWW